ncbi:MAG TPA: hypothetical protein ENN29_01235, partial [Candidatus Hydrogenedentes bacterium]|nr:hypothetical protein [Candidatus Hydrogenedentota bacterium]
MNRMTVIIGLVILTAVVIVPLSRQDKPEQAKIPPPPGNETMQENGAPPVNEGLEVVALYPPGGQTPDTEIIVYFNEALADFQPPEGTTERAITTIPRVWGIDLIKNNYLRFSGDKIIKGAFDDPKITQLEIVLHENLRSVTGQALAPEMRRHFFDAPPPHIASARLEDIAEQNAVVQVTFSRVADLSLLPDLLSVVDRYGNPVDAAVSPDSNGFKAMLSFPLATEPPITIAVAPGLRWGENNRYVAADMSARYPKDTSLKAYIGEVKTGTQPSIELLFSQQVPLQWLQTLTTVKIADSGDSVSFAIASSEPPGPAASRATLSLSSIPEIGDANNLMVEISPWLRSVKGERHLANTAIGESRSSGRADRRERQRFFEMYYNYWETNMADGLVLRLNFSHAVSPDTFKEHVTITPPVELVVAEGDRWSRGLRIKGNFKSETDYTLRIAGGLKDSNGKTVLVEDSSFALQTTPLRKGAAFDTTHLYYFPRRNMARPAVQARNITEAEVTLAQVFPSNLPVFVRDFSGSGASPHLLAQYAREIGRVKVAFPEAPDTLLAGAADLDALLPADSRGVFIMTVNPSYDHRDSSRALIYTDLGALTHWTNKELVVFAHNLFTLEPVARAEVTVYSNKFQPIGATYTNEDGIARFMSFEAAYGAPALAVIKADNDYTFVDLLRQQETKDAFTASMPHYDRDGYDAYIYLDRNLYRPGETARIRYLVRTRYVDAVADVPFQLRIANPQGRWIYETPVTPNEFGAGTLSFKTEQTHPTGKYRVELRVPEAPTPTGRATFNLEEFVPNRMRAEVKYDCERLAPGATANIHVKAENLYGGPAAGRKTEARVYLRPTTYATDAWPGYHFGNEDVLEDKLIQLGEAVTDANGMAAFTYTFAPPPGATMPLEAVVGARVFEVGGRAVSDTTAVKALPAEVLPGIAVAPRDDAEVLDVHVVAIRSDATAADLDTLQLTLEREEWNYHVRGFGHNHQTRWEKEFRLYKTLEVPLSEGKVSAQLPYPDYGTYRLRVHSPETPMYSALHFNRWWGQLRVVSSARPELISLSVDKELYQAGDQLRLRIESPYDGNAFVVAQGEKIHEQRVVPVEGGEGAATLVVPHEWFPNAWIQVTVVRDTAQQEGSQYPYSSFAMINVPLDAPDRRIAVSLPDVPEEIRPSEPYTLRIATHDAAGAPVAAEVTVAAVDEGIHGILGYDNPDPYQWFQRSRRFGLRRAHYYE